MKTQKVILSALLPLTCLLLASCDNLARNQSSDSPFLSPKGDKVHFNPQGEKVVKLDPVNFKEWRDPELQALELKIRASREKRVEEKLADLKEERLHFTNPILTLKENGQELVTIDVKFKNGTEKITFLSPIGHGPNFYFERVSGFESRAVKLQGMCLDEGQTCNKIAIQVSYIFKRLKVTEQFIMNTGLEEDTIQPNDHLEDDGIQTIDGDPKIPMKLEEKIDIDSETPSKKDLIIIDDEKKASFDLSPNGEDDDEILEPSVDLSGDADEDAVTQINSLAPKSTLRPKARPDAPPTVAFSAPPAVTQSTLDSTTKTEKQNPSLFALDQEEGEEVEETNDSLTGTTVKDQVEVEQAELETAEEPEALSPPDHTENNEELMLGDGQIIFPDISETGIEISEEEPTPTQEFNVNSGETNKVAHPLSTMRPRLRPKRGQDTSLSNLLTDIKNKTYNQSRGFYSAHAVRGRIKNADQLEKDLRGAVANPNRRSRQYASGMMTSILKLAADKLNEKYPKSPLCVNDLSSKTGGVLGAHGSHRNGLDADISLPATSNQCSGTFFHSWDGLKNKDSKFLEKNWFFINSLLETERVHVIFVSQNFTKALCTYAKSNTNLSRAKRNEVFKKLHHISGHHNHYHLRLKCNKQNPGCITQGILRGSTCN